MKDFELLRWTDKGLWCEQGDFYIDPIRSVDRAVITHAHADHARRGMRHYLAHHHTVNLMRLRLGHNLSATSTDYGVDHHLNGVRIRLVPAGHCMGSAQVRVEYKGEVWVVSGDYKRGQDPYAAEFEPTQCNTFITESTFALPVYRWPSDDELVSSILRWADAHAACEIATVLRCYPLGKAQRLVGLLAPHASLVLSDSIANTNEALGLAVPPGSQNGRTIHITSVNTAPVRGPYVTAFASGWMLTQKGQNMAGGFGFPVSDHADWDGLLQTVKESGADRILVTHGFADAFSRYLVECGYDAGVLR